MGRDAGGQADFAALETRSSGRLLHPGTHSERELLLSHSEMPEDDDNLETPPQKSGKSILVVLLVVCLAAGGAGAWFFLRHHHASPQSGGAAEGTKVSEVLHLEDFIVNLADQDTRAFIKIGIDIGQSEVPKSHKETAPNPVPAVRDAILSVIAGYKSDELLTPDGKTKLKHELLQALHERVPEAHALEVYFTEFLVQR